MKRTNTRYRLGRALTQAAVCLAALFPVSCNETMDRMLQDDYPEQSTDYPAPRVLMIVLDGVNGLVVRDAINAGLTPTLRTLRYNSMYSFEGLVEANGVLPELTPDRGWANLLTGITSHGVGIEDKPLSELEQTTFLQRIRQARPETKIGLFVSEQPLYDALSRSATLSERLADDQAVIASIGSQLKSDSPADLIVAQLNGVKIAGQTSGYFEANQTPTQAVSDAVVTADAQIGELMKTLEARPNYARENWMVVIASSFGGEAEGNFGTEYFNDPRRNIFCLFYNAKLAPKNYLKPASDSKPPYTYFTPVYSGKDAFGVPLATVCARVQDPSLYNMHTRPEDLVDNSGNVLMPKLGAYTIQYMINDRNAANGTFPILTKRARWAVDAGSGRSVGNGWSIIYNGATGLRNIFNSHTDHQSNPSSGLTKNGWHVITVVLKASQNASGTWQSNFRIYLNGNLNFERIGNLRSELMHNDYPLTIGWVEGAPTGNAHQFSITNLQFYDAALPEEYIKANFDKTRLEEYGSSLEYWDNLIGYWPCDREDDYQQNVLKDYSQYGSVLGGVNAGKSDMQIEGNVVWRVDAVGAVEANISPQPDNSVYRQVFNAVDVPAQVMQWLGVPVKPDWQLEGISRPVNYDLE
jgi:hypothetical protein